jgi:hypothetical protein
MTFSTKLAHDAYFHASGACVMSDSQGYNQTFQWKMDNLVPIGIGTLVPGDIRLISIIGAETVITNLILDIPGKVLYYMTGLGKYVISTCTMTDYDNGVYPSRIDWNGAHAIELDNSDKTILLDEVIQRNMWHERDEYIKAYLIVANLPKLV